MFKVGLTGGIGSGKSLVSEMFLHLGIPVFNADIEAKIILNADQELKQQIENVFGDIYKNSEIDRKKLASIIFNDKEALKTINSLIHPKVRTHFHSWVEQQVQTKYIVEEAAILFESNAYKELDITINVHADELIRIDRVVKRDKTTAEAVRKNEKSVK